MLPKHNASIGTPIEVIEEEESRKIGSCDSFTITCFTVGINPGTYVLM